MRDGDQVSRALREGLAAARHRPACGFLASVSPTAVETSPGDEHRHGAGRRGGGRCIEHRDPAVLRGEVGCLQQLREAGNESFIPGSTSSPGQARCRRAPPPDRRVARHARRRAGCRASRSRSSATACVAAASRAPTSPGRKRPTPRSSAGATCALRAARSSSSFRAGSAGGCGTRSRRSRTRWRCGATRARAPSRRARPRARRGLADEPHPNSGRLCAAGSGARAPSTERPCRECSGRSASGRRPSLRGSPRTRPCPRVRSRGMLSLEGDSSTHEERCRCEHERLQLESTRASALSPRSSSEIVPLHVARLV